MVCHDDACVPNTLLADDGSYVGTVDLGSLGTADRWADLAVAIFSLGRDFPGAWTAELFDAYGIDADQTRLQYYRRLWDAT